MDGGCSVQLLTTYYPPSGCYEVQSEVWDNLPVAVKVPAGPRWAGAGAGGGVFPAY